eukprot:6173634-Pleurochrysis_carterae.AAC.4
MSEGPIGKTRGEQDTQRVRSGSTHTCSQAVSEVNVPQAKVARGDDSNHSREVLRVQRGSIWSRADERKVVVVQRELLAL